MINMIRRGRTEAVEQLLEYKDVDIHQKDQDEITPFAAACMGGSVTVVNRLMRLVDREEIVGKDRLSRTPFFLAARENQTEVVRRLMQLDMIDVNIPDALGRTPLHIAVQFSFYGISPPFPLMDTLWCDGVSIELCTGSPCEYQMCGSSVRE